MNTTNIKEFDRNSLVRLLKDKKVEPCELRSAIDEEIARIIGAKKSILGWSIPKKEYRIVDLDRILQTAGIHEVTAEQLVKEKLYICCTWIELLLNATFDQTISFQELIDSKGDKRYVLTSEGIPDTYGGLW